MVEDRRHIGLSINDLLTALPTRVDLPHDEIIMASRTHVLTHLHTITPIACVLSLLHAARRANAPCAIASGASRLLVDPGVDTLGLRKKFRAIVVREDVPRGKPAPDLFVEGARRLGAPPGRCLSVERP